ncbi:MAG: hypothetical protein V4719_20255 [Planctomycetota bacterium]
MLLSRIFSLMLGTTMFVAIWSMQDGDHSRHLRAGADTVPSVQPAEVPHQPESSPAVSSHPLRVTAVSATSESTLWMFADEPAERIAIK